MTIDRRPFGIEARERNADAAPAPAPGGSLPADRPEPEDLTEV